MNLQWAGMTHPGKVRKNNEDVFLALNFDRHELRYLGKTGEGSMEGADYVFAVSDGMGGAKSGEFASRVAVDKITHLLPRNYGMTAQQLEGGTEDILHELFERIHRTVLDYGQHYEECAGMGATLSLCWFMPGWMSFGHIGDSRIYHLPTGGEMVQLSEDHSHVGWLRRQGRLNEREARVHPHRNALAQALGGGQQQIEPHIGRVRCHPGDRFLICSDGLIDGLWDWRIGELAREPGPPSVEVMVRESVEASGRDNTTALLVEVG